MIYNKKRLIKKAIEFYISEKESEENNFDNYFEIKNMKELLSDLDQKADRFELLYKKGGSWLGAVRNWIQQRKYVFGNGEIVTWGSNEVLYGSNITVRDLESLAALIAAEAINEERER